MNQSEFIKSVLLPGALIAASALSAYPQIAHVYTTSPDRSKDLAITNVWAAGNSTTDAIVLTNNLNQEIRVFDTF